MTKEIFMTTQDIKKALGNELCDIRCGKSDSFDSLCYDSRKATSASCFVCLKGALADGHAYIDKAVASGACVIVASDRNAYENKRKE